MKYENPVLRGMYPDPSVIKVKNIYYMVCSTMHLFPGVPVFESKDLVNWKQIGHCLTRRSQVNLDKVNSSGGIFAPTIRYHKGRFYMVTTNSTYGKNFYVYTDDIYGEWSEPIIVEQGGIDPSLYFEGDKAYFMSTDEEKENKGKNAIYQCEIDIETGKKLTESTIIWRGTGGRYLEGPHLYRINDMYYLMAAEGGTEYGHMITYARGKSINGPFESYVGNPVLTNRNLGGYILQGVGHGDLVEDEQGNWWILHLGFRQEERYVTFHQLGREVCLTPVTWDENGWFTAGEDGICKIEFETDRIPDSVVQKLPSEYTIENTEWKKDWCTIRIPDAARYELGKNYVKLLGSSVNLSDMDAPAFIGLRQKDFDAVITCDVKVSEGEAGLSLYLDESHHYDFFVNADKKAGERLCIGDIKSIEAECPAAEETITLKITADSLFYTFTVISDGKETALGKAQCRYLSSEVAGGFTGVIIGMYATGNGKDCKEPAEFTNYRIQYVRNKK